MNTNKTEVIKSIIAESIRVKQSILEDPDFISAIDRAAGIVTSAFEQGKKVLFCGNGGSAADAQHLAAEFSGRFYKNRPPLYSEALHVNTSYLTAVANDFSYDEVYARMVQAMGSEGDVLVALSTSGNSPNIIRAIEEASKLSMTVVGMTGSNGGRMKDLCDCIFRVLSNDTPRIQESHIMIGHIICYLVEDNLF